MIKIDTNEINDDVNKLTSQKAYYAGKASTFTASSYGSSSSPELSSYLNKINVIYKDLANNIYNIYSYLTSYAAAVQRLERKYSKYSVSIVNIEDAALFPKVTYYSPFAGVSFNADTVSISTMATLYGLSETELASIIVDGKIDVDKYNELINNILSGNDEAKKQTFLNAYALSKLDGYDKVVNGEMTLEEFYREICKDKALYEEYQYAYNLASYGIFNNIDDVKNTI